MMMLRRTKTRVEQPSSAQMKHLQQWLVADGPELADVQEFEAVLESATDERPLQEVLAAHPSLLRVLLSGTWENAVRPLPRLDGHFVPDFVLAEADSAGIHWWLVELESPKARMLLPDGRLADKAREAVSQIRSWREYLSERITHARLPESEGGLGLVGLRPHKARGLVLIGRRDQTASVPQHERDALASESLILVRSYDWLLQVLRSGAPIGGYRPLHHELQESGVALDELAWG
jgi:hypothetical protein